MANGRALCPPRLLAAGRVLGPGRRSPGLRAGGTRGKIASRALGPFGSARTDAFREGGCSGRTESAGTPWVWGARGAQEGTGRAGIRKSGPCGARVSGTLRAPGAASSIRGKGGRWRWASAQAGGKVGPEGDGQRPLTSSCRQRAQGDAKVGPSLDRVRLEVECCRPPLGLGSSRRRHQLKIASRPPRTWVAPRNPIQGCEACPFGKGGCLFPGCTQSLWTVRSETLLYWEHSVTSFLLSWEGSAKKT